MPLSMYSITPGKVLTTCSSTAGIKTRVSAVSARTLFEIVSKAFRSVAFESIIPRALGCKGL